MIRGGADDAAGDDGWFGRPRVLGWSWATDRRLDGLKAIRTKIIDPKRSALPRTKWFDHAESAFFMAK